MGQLEIPVVEALAEACHEAWRKKREDDGWEWAAKRDDARRKHPLLIPYSKLSEQAKEANHLSARLAEAKLLEVRISIEPRGASDKRTLPDEEYAKHANTLAEIEHDIWLRDRLLSGYEWAKESDDDVRQNRHIAPFDALAAEEQDLDRAIVCSIPEALKKAGYRLVEAE